MYILPCQRITRGSSTERMERRQQRSHGTVCYIESTSSIDSIYFFNFTLKINSPIVHCQVRETRINVDNQWSLE